jgi:mycothione reductase
VFSAFGSDVTFILRSDRFLRGEDEAISHRFTEIYTREYDVRLRTEIHGARREGEEVVLDISTHGERFELRGDAVLVATGRIPNGDQLDVAATGVALDDDGYVITDSHLRTTVDGIWALGDITSAVQLKHAANHEAKVVAHNLVEPDNPIEVDDRYIPHAVFGHPQVAGVGLTERDCITHGRPYISHVQEYCSAAYGWAMEDTDSFVKVIADPHSRLLIGAHIIGPQAPTLIQQLIQGMVFGQTVDQMAHDQYYIHPGLPEVVEQALLEL